MAPDVIWILLVLVLLAIIMFFGMGFSTFFGEMWSFVIVAGILALIFASRDIIIISIAVLLIAKKVLSKRKVTHEYDVDSAAWGLR